MATIIMKVIHRCVHTCFAIVVACCVFALIAHANVEDSVGKQVSDSKIRHSFLITGPDTALIDESGEIVWRCKGGSRDGFALANGTIGVYEKDKLGLDSKSKQCGRN